MPSGTDSPLCIGPLRIDFPVVQAPLSGYSDGPMRVIARRLGAPYVVAGAMLDQFMLQVCKGRKARRHLRVTDEEHPCGGQLLGAAPEEMALAAVKLVEAGFDVVDLNFACPVKKVLGRCRGGYLLGQPQTALEIVARVRDVLPPEVPLTIKMRRGMDDTEQSREAFFAIFDGAFRLGAAAITVHGRTVQQQYAGESSCEFIAQVKRHAGDRTVLGSGDLLTAESCLRMLRQTGVDGVTAARGAIGNPWIFRQARALAAGQPPPWPSLEEQRCVMEEHYRLAEEVYGSRRCCRLMRGFGIKYSRLHPQAQQVRDALIAVREPEQWRAVLETWYAEDLPGHFPLAEPD
jgi:tRNA-dihydrouridine synthase B